MQPNEPDPVKTAGSHDKQITVELDDERTITAQHHIVNDDAQLMHLYLGDRSDGIDVTIPLAGSSMTAAARSNRGRAALGIDTDTGGDADTAGDDVESDRVLVTDGGRDVGSGDNEGDGDDVDVQARADDADDDEEQLRVDDFGDRRLITDGGIPGHVNRSQANGARPVRPDDEDSSEVTDLGDVGECENPLCCDDVCSSTECVALVSDARCAADASIGYDSLLMPTADRATTGAVLAALNRQGRLDGGDE